MSGITDREASTAGVAMGLAWRSLVNILRVPGAVVPVIVMPIFFLVAFSGSFSGLSRGGLVPTDTMVNWVFPYSILQGAAFAGMGTTFGAARDLETGFYDRLLLASAPRRSLLLGPVLAAAIRAMVPVTAVTVIAFSLGGARFTDWRGFVTLLVAAVCVAAIASLWGLGIAYRFRTQRATGLVQIGIFSAMFLSASQVPVEHITGWVKPIARINPVTNILRLARQGFLPGGVTWGDTWGGLVAIAGCLVFFSIWAWRGFRTLVR